MSDIVSKEIRSKIMKSVKPKRNKTTELELIKLFKNYGIFGWRRNYNITGRPDFVFTKLKIAVFADGCFWHGHNCRNLSPVTNSEYWINKINYNKNHDLKITDELEKRGWRIIRIWECDIKRGVLPIELVDSFKKTI